MLPRVGDEHPLHRRVAAIGQDDRTGVAEAIPEELLTIEGLPRAMHKGRPERRDREAGVRVQAEQRAFAGCFVLRVRIRTIVRHQGFALEVVESRPIRGNARDEHVAMEAVPAAARRGFDLVGCRAVLPVVHEMVHGVEAPFAQHTLHGREVAAIRLHVADLRTEVVMIAPVEDGHLVSSLRETLHGLAANEQRSADHENSHAGIIGPRPG